MAATDAERDEFMQRFGLKLDPEPAELEWSPTPQWLCRAADGPVLLKDHPKAEAEARTLRRIEEHDVARRSAPRLVGHSASFIAHRWPRDSRTLRARQRESFRELLQRCEPVGSSLAALHQIEAKGLLDRQYWNIQELIWPVPWQYAQASGASLQLIATVQADRAAVEQLERMHMAMSSASKLVHTGATLRNIVFDDGCVLFVDWGSAVAGEPVADLGSIAADLIRAHLAPEDPRDRLDVPQVRRALSAFFDGYGAPRSLRVEALRWSGARLIDREDARAFSDLDLRWTSTHLVHVGLMLIVDPGFFSSSLLGSGKRLPVGRAPSSRRRASQVLKSIPAEPAGDSALLRELAPVVGGLQRPKPIAAVADLLYARLFTRTEHAPAGAVAFESPFARCTTWSEGWQVTGRPFRGRVAITSGGLTLFATPDELSAQTGDVKLRLPCINRSQPGFHNVTSPDGAPTDDAPHYKLYLHLAPRGVQAFLDALITARGRYTAKVFQSVEDFGRADTALVYVDPAHGPAVAEVLCALERARPELFKGPPPLLTMPLSASIGVAESIPHARSYGQLSCELLARGVVAAIKAKARFGDAWLPHLERAFAADGRTLEAPWRKTLSFDGFHARA